MASSVLISGAGQLGSRYLQGLARCRCSLRVYVHDVHEESLGRAAQRWGEVRPVENPHEVSFHPVLDAVPANLDIVIVATTADVRARVVRAIACHAAVRYWVLEKILAQSEADLEELAASVTGSPGAWVNTPRRMMPWYRQIRSHTTSDRPLTLEVKGGEWGLACNAVHFLDLLAWWTGEKLENIRTEGLSSAWFESKRRGFSEVSGTLEARYSNGSCARLTAAQGAVPTSMVVGDGQQQLWQIDEAAGFAKRSDGMEVPGRIAYQSEISGGLVESILEEGRCDLPLLEESAALHRIFIRGMHEHWKQAGHPSAPRVPIT